MTARLSLAAAALPQSGRVLLIGPDMDFDVAALEGCDIVVLQDMMPAAATWSARGLETVQSLPEGPFDASIVCLPRAKDAARARIAAAMSVTSGMVFVDGLKTTGAESLLRDMRKRTEVLGTVSKAHGKLFWAEATPAFEDWTVQPNIIEDRWHTVPGVFSAQAIDPGSALLADTLPGTLSGSVADLGAGWGYLSARLLDRCEKIKTLHLVEAHATALDCARKNVQDPRAQFVWADATDWAGVRNLDAVVMNPPFHTGRAAEPDLGKRFIAAAARLLRPGGALWMVANRHLPYEQTLRDHFVEVAEIGGTSKFKVLSAKAKSRPRR